MTTHIPAAAKIVADLKARFFPTPTYRQLQLEFDLLLEQRRANLRQGRQQEVRGLLVVAPSGAGKTTLVARVLRQHPSGLRMLTEGEERADIVSMVVPSPATPKGVGLDMLEALGYPLRRDRSAHIIWQLVKTQFAQRQVLFLHLDEAQDFSRHNNHNDRHAVISTLKSLTQSPQWPVGLILSGTPELLDLVNMDAQLARRLKPVEHRPLKTSVDGGMITAALRQYAAAADITLDDALCKPRFVHRLVHAADYCFGILVEMICEAIGEVLLAGEDILSTKSFVTCFSRRSGCPEGLNPFVVEDFLALDVRRLLQPEPGPGNQGRPR
ncbi:TniB family NTP-binding protein [Paracoccus versutus]|uniref:TniB family NTP-binding protein n=1 Tax=Paracoccus versutus TaxID=34007 RepID=UPI000DF81A3E|nr:TniB family NTP-binding protein [Paracoccus versutus]RDD72764.1 AAA family ATPase [Paracoccus versutus]